MLFFSKVMRDPDVDYQLQEEDGYQEELEDEDEAGNVECP